MSKMDNNAAAPETARREDVQQLAKKMRSGTFMLETPIKAGEKEFTELKYDFSRLSGWDYADAMDSDTTANNSFRMSTRQAIALFAKTAAKENEGIDALDILERMGICDAMKAAQLAAVFFVASNRAGDKRIVNKP